MTGFRLTGLEVGAFAICSGALAAWVWMQVMKRHDARAAAESRRRAPSSRFVVADGWPPPSPCGPFAARAGLGRVVRIPPRPAPLLVHPECLDEAEVAADANLLIAAAAAACRRDAEIQANARLMDEYASQFPMQVRPRLVERASDSNPLDGDH